MECSIEDSKVDLAVLHVSDNHCNILKLVKYLHVKADKPWHNYYIC